MVPSSFFILASSVCKYLQCLISTLTQAGEGGHLFRFTYSSSVVGWEGHCKWILLGCQGCSHFMGQSGFATGQVCVCFLGLHGSGSRVFCTGTVPSGPWDSCISQVQATQVLGIPQGHRLVGHVFWALPRSEQLRWQGAWRAQCPRWAMCLTHLISATQFPGCAVTALSQLCPVSPLGSWSQAVTLLVDVNHPGSQEDMASNWESAHSLVEDTISGSEIAAVPYLPTLVVTHLPLCLPQERGLYCSLLALLWYSLSPLFYECARLQHQSLVRESSVCLCVCVCVFVWQSQSLGCYLMLVPTDCPQGIQALSLP